MNVYVLMTNDEIWCIRKTLKGIAEEIKEAIGDDNLKIQDEGEITEYTLDDGIQYLLGCGNEEVVNEQLLERGDEYVDMRIEEEEVK